MSKIFDALKQSESSVVRVIETEQRDQPVTPVNAEMTSAGIPETPRPAYEMPQEPQLVEPSKRAGLSPYRTIRMRVRSDSPVLPFDGGDQRTAECYRILRTKLLHHPARPKMIAVTSAGSGDGKTTSAINIAGVLALRQDVQVLVVDADLRHASVARLLGIESAPGLAAVLTGQCSLDEAIVQAEHLPNLHVLPAGRVSGNPVELLDSSRWKGVADDARKRFHFVIVDTTPVGLVADFDLIQVVCDGTIVVVRPDHTDRKACLKTLETIPKEKMLGTLLNCSLDWFLWKTHSDYGYYDGDKPKAEK